jgi:glycoside hydrolase-like protein
MPASTLPGTLQPAPAGTLGFDVNQPLTAATAQAFKNAGYNFCVRYIPRILTMAANNLTNAEARTILNASLALMAVQHASPSGWQPTTSLGTTYGNNAATYASEIVGLPQGMILWCDLEDIPKGTDTKNIIAYCQAWYYAVHAAGYVPGIYIGFNVWLTPAQLHDDISFQHYWQAYNGSLVATRGFQLLQHTHKTLNGIDFDPDVTQNDNLGDSALWLSL